MEKKRELCETAEDREGRLAKERKLKKIKRTLVSSYTREERLAKDREYKRMKLANESQEAKAARLAKGERNIMHKNFKTQKFIKLQK